MQYESSYYLSFKAAIPIQISGVLDNLKLWRLKIQYLMGARLNYCHWNPGIKLAVFPSPKSLFYYF